MIDEPRTPTVAPGGASEPPLVTAESITFAYPGHAPTLCDVSFALERGDKAVLLGSNGCGKTTLLRILDGLIFPQRGRVLHESLAVTETALRNREFCRRYRQEVALLFQNPDSMLFHPTVREEIAFGPRQMEFDDIDDRVTSWASTLQIGKLLDRPPFRLSSGEKQKVCLAALLVLEPKLLLLDEPTANLDPRSTGWLVDFLQDLDLTVLVTTHNLSLAGELGKRCLVLSEDHRVIYDGDLDPILEDMDLLLRANLVHTHRHRHDGVEHRHPHVHDWD